MAPSSAHSPAELPRAPETLEWREQNEWINDRTRQVQGLWHDLFDADTSDYATENPRPDPLPTHADNDLRLMFGLPLVTTGTRRSCYALFPAGEEMCRRFELYVSSPAPELTQPEARSLIAQLAELVASVAPDAHVGWDHVTFAAESDPGIVDAMGHTGNISELLEGLPRASQRGGDPASRTANYFLSDVHYYAAGNYYEMHEWVCGAMLDETLDQIYEIPYRLWRAGWQVFCNQEGVLLVNRGA